MSPPSAETLPWPEANKETPRSAVCKQGLCRSEQDKALHLSSSIPWQQHTLQICSEAEAGAGCRHHHAARSTDEGHHNLPPSCLHAFQLCWLVQPAVWAPGIQHCAQWNVTKCLAALQLLFAEGGGIDGSHSASHGLQHVGLAGAQNLQGGSV